MDRRTFSKSIASGFTLAASGLSVNTLAAMLGGDDNASACPSCAQFKRLLGSQYTVTGHPQGMLELAMIEAVGTRHAEEQFYVCFRQTPELNLDDGIYQLVDPGGPSLTLRLNPSHTRPQMMEAVINLQTSA